MSDMSRVLGTHCDMDDTPDPALAILLKYCLYSSGVRKVAGMRVYDNRLLHLFRSVRG